MPQKMISFFPIYTKLCYRKRRLIDKLYKCRIIVVVTFLEKKSMVTLANEVLQKGPNTSSLYLPPLLSHGQPFPTAFTLLKRDLFKEHNPSMMALILDLTKLL